MDQEDDVEDQVDRHADDLDVAGFRRAEKTPKNTISSTGIILIISFPKGIGFERVNKRPNSKSPAKNINKGKTLIKPKP